MRASSRREIPTGRFDIGAAEPGHAKMATRQCIPFRVERPFTVGSGHILVRAGQSERGQASISCPVF